MATFIPAENAQPVREVAPGNGRDFQLHELYELLDCQTIEVLYLGNGRSMVIDGEGKLLAAPVRNERATTLADFVTPAQMTSYLLALREAGIDVIRTGGPNDMESDFIAGDVLICEEHELR
jgi:hypothetical protein